METHTDLSINSLGTGRAELGLSYKLTAGLIKLPTPQLLAKWEKGEMLPSLKYFSRLMALYHSNLVAMYPNLYKDAVDTINSQKERLGVADRLKPSINQSNYMQYQQAAMNNQLHSQCSCTCPQDIA